MSYETIQLEKRRGLGVLTLSRPRRRNAANRQMLGELGQALAAVDADPDIRALIVTGAGQAFQSGADIKEMAGFSALEAIAFLEGFTNVTLALETLRQPTIAAINGPAYGGGFEMALACDMRVMEASAMLALPETGLGLIPGAGGCERLPLLVGRGLAAELILTGRAVGAEEALALGLINRTTAEGQALAEAEDLARPLLAKAPLALDLAKQALRRAAGADLAGRMADTARACALCFTSEDRTEGLAAFLEKRPARFIGR